MWWPLVLAYGWSWLDRWEAYSGEDTDEPDANTADGGADELDDDTADVIPAAKRAIAATPSSLSGSLQLGHSGMVGAEAAGNRCSRPWRSRKA